jgi:predicted HicB family RNase H-like nuclease
VAPDDVAVILSAYNILLHPSFNENFGHSIAEALQCHVAVLTGDATPWNWLNETGGGAAINPLHENDYVNTLKMWLKMNDSEFLEFCKKGAMAFRSRFSLHELKLKYRHLFYAD